MYRRGDMLVDRAFSDELTGGQDGASIAGWFLTIWPLAVLFHLAGNDSWLLEFAEPVGWAQLPLLVSATFLLCTRRTKWALLVAVIHLLVVVIKLPTVGNHEVFLVLIDLTVLGAIGLRRVSWPEAVLAPLRWILLIGYGAIAFSKLNHGFLDPAVSCAAVFGDEFGRWFGVTVSNSSVLTSAAIWGTLIVELSIPVLLAMRRTRRHGVVLALVFHTILAIEPFGHVFDFTSVLYVLFFCFLTPGSAAEVTTGIQRLRDRIGTTGILGIVVTMVVGNIATHELLTRGFPTPTWLFDYPFFMIYAGLVLQFVPGLIFGHERAPLRFAMHPAFGLIVLLALLNAVAPYAEVRTSGAFNMYSNLAVTEGSSNHLVVGDLAGGRSQDMYQVVSVGDGSGLIEYVEQRLVIPHSNLVQYANDHPDDESLVQLYPLADDEPVPLSSLRSSRNTAERFIHRLFLRRAVQMDAPESCLRSWGPAN